MKRAIGAVCGGLVMAAMLAGCSSNAVGKDDVANQIEEKLEQQVGTRPDVTCPEDLPAEDGASIVCKLTTPDMEDGSYLGVTATVSNVDGNKVNFDIKVDDEVTNK